MSFVYIHYFLRKTLDFIKKTKQELRNGTAPLGALIDYFLVKVMVADSAVNSSTVKV
jgi:hypothetical protein